MLELECKTITEYNRSRILKKETCWLRSHTMKQLLYSEMTSMLQNSIPLRVIYFCIEERSATPKFVQSQLTSVALTFTKLLNLSRF